MPAPHKIVGVWVKKYAHQIDSITSIISLIAAK